ncbi:MAG: DEAD/DEAH box helicase [Pirellulales bacterium]|nr:DEAD/DEAH box helicase [Pirellulales bacterium]
MTITFDEFFQRVSGGFPPHSWQRSLATSPSCTNRMVSVGTGMGKTLGGAATWAYHRLIQPHPQTSWPRRLVWCLPMRVLVEQTAGELGRVAEVVRDQTGHKLDVHTLMGGVDAEPWHLFPEREAILVGTQDMLLSRALNRGYASPRGRWPMEFALLNQDVLWVLDEVQLQGVAAVTATQLQTFRQKDENNGKSVAPSHTWWMSATLRDRWVDTMDSQPLVQAASQNGITVPADDKAADVYTACKPVTVVRIEGKPKLAATSIAKLVWETHQNHSPENQGRITLVVLNTVFEAVAVHRQLKKSASTGETELKLIHSRFRGHERKQWRDGEGVFLSKSACLDSTADRILVATQVVEAGVDISASCLVTELAPWPSLVQRFGRAARYGGRAEVVVIDRGKKAKSALPYQEDCLDAALEAANEMDDVGLLHLDPFDERLAADPPRDQKLFDFRYIHQFQQSDLDELFDTSPDLTGDDIDVSRFLREGEDTNVHLVWFDRQSLASNSAKTEPPAEFQPRRDDRCPVGIADAKEFLFGPKTRVKHFEACNGPWAYCFSFDDSRWLPMQRGQQLRPGQIVLVDSRIGGYQSEVGFTGELLPKKMAFPNPVRFDDSAANDVPSPQEFGLVSDPISQSKENYQFIHAHGSEVANKLIELASEYELTGPTTLTLKLAAELHDVGKAHPAFRCNIVTDDPPWAERDDLAKAPNWLHFHDHRYGFPEQSGIERFESLGVGKRKGLRHELASMLAVAQWIKETGHVAMSGEEFDADEENDVARLNDSAFPPPWTEVINRLDQQHVNLLLYLIAAHHGKVRGGLQMTPHDQDFRPLAVAMANQVAAVGSEDHEPGTTVLTCPDSIDRLPIRGVREGDTIGGLQLNVDGRPVEMPQVTLHTDLAHMGWSERYGDSWTERVIDLVHWTGTFRLAMYETLIRAADIRVSRGIA